MLRRDCEIAILTRCLSFLSLEEKIVDTQQEHDCNGCFVAAAEVFGRLASSIAEGTLVPRKVKLQGDSALCLSCALRN